MPIGHMSNSENKIRVVHICAAANNGGYIAAKNLHEGLDPEKYDSVIFVRDRNRCLDSNLMALDDSKLWWLWFRMRGLLSNILHLVLLGRGAIKSFHLQAIPCFVFRWIRRTLKPDIVHIHAGADSLWALQEIVEFESPVVWTFHGLREVTQGYLIMGENLLQWHREGRKESVYDRDERLAAKWNLKRKRKLLAKRNDICVAPSVFVHDVGVDSGVFEASAHSVIPNGVNLKRFYPREKIESRKRFGIPLKKRVILAGAQDVSDPNKGVDLLLEALQINLSSFEDVVIVFFGGGAAPEIGPLETISLGFITHEDMPYLYSASDLTIVPSREDNYPNVIVESVACGTPYVGFDTGGVGDLSRRVPEAGCVVKPYDVSALHEAICCYMNSSVIDPMELAEKVKEVCCSKVAAKAYDDVYQSCYNSKIS